MPDKLPKHEDVDAQVGRLVPHLSEMQEFLLRYLIKAQREQRWSKRKATGAQILFEFYVEWAKFKEETPPTRRNGDLDLKSRQAIKGPREAVEIYYLKHALPEHTILIQIPEGNKSHYQPCITYRQVDPWQGPDFEFIGKSVDALKELIEMIPQARRIEDTTVRWNIAPSLYTDMQDYIVALRNSDAEFRSITGPVQDEAHVKALREVYGKQAGDKERRRGQIKCFRLHHAAALMNFVLVYPKNRPLPAVLFGYGTQRKDLRDEQTPVFRSTDERIVKEFQRLFNELRTPQFSRKISVDDPDFVVSHANKCDVVATFDRFPGTEVMDRIKACRERIAICTTAWSAFDLFTRELQRALENGCSIEIALWRDNSPFAESRGKEVGDNNDLKLTIAQNKLILEALEGHPKFRGRWCNGQGSVSIFWIDDLIYFSPYWSGMRSSDGTHFLVYAESDTGQHLQRQYRVMLPPEEALGVARNLSTGD